MTISVRFSELDGILIKRYASYNKITVSGFIKKVVLDEIEREYLRIKSEMEEMLNGKEGIN